MTLLIVPSFTERKCVFKVFDSTKVDEEDLLVYTSLFVPVIHSQKKIYLYFFFFRSFTEMAELWDENYQLTNKKRKIQFSFTVA